MRTIRRFAHELYPPGLVTVIDMPEDQCPTCCEPEEDAS